MLQLSCQPCDRQSHHIVIIPVNARDQQRALKVADKWQRELHAYNIPYTDTALTLARCYYESGREAAGDEITANLLRRSDEWLTWIATIGRRHRQASVYTLTTWLDIMEQALMILP